MLTQLTNLRPSSHMIFVSVTSCCFGHDISLIVLPLLLDLHWYQNLYEMISSICLSKPLQCKDACSTTAIEWDTAKQLLCLPTMLMHRLMVGYLGNDEKESYAKLKKALCQPRFSAWTPNSNCAAGSDGVRKHQ